MIHGHTMIRIKKILLLSLLATAMAINASEALTTDDARVGSAKKKLECKQSSMPWAEKRVLILKTLDAGVHPNDFVLSNKSPLEEAISHMDVVCVESLIARGKLHNTICIGIA